MRQLFREAKARLERATLDGTGHNILGTIIGVTQEVCTFSLVALPFTSLKLNFYHWCRRHLTFARISELSLNKVGFDHSLRRRLLHQVTGATTIRGTEVVIRNIIMLSVQEGEVRSTMAAFGAVEGARLQHFQEGGVLQIIVEVKAVEVTKESTRGRRDEK